MWPQAQAEAVATMTANYHDNNAITSVIKDALLRLCKTNVAYGGRVEVDGIICISGENKEQNLVVKVHEQIFQPYSDTTYNHKVPNGLGNFKSHKQPSPGRDNDFSLSPSDRVNNNAPAEIYKEDYQGKLEPIDLTHDQNQDNSQDVQMDTSDNAAEDEVGIQYQKPSIFGGQSEYRPQRSFHQRSPKRLSAHHRYGYPPDRWHSPGFSPISASPAECKTCGVRCASYQELQDHNEGVHNASTCPQCYRTFTSRSNLERHLRLHTGHKPYICVTCGKAFSRKDHLSNHASKHAFKCGTCLKRFSDKEVLRIHYLQDHSAVLVNTCDQCNKGFSDPEVYAEHQKIHPSEGFKVQPQGTPSSIRALTCDSCEFMTQDKLEYVKHCLVHGEAPCQYTCMACLKIFSDPLAYCDHLDDAHPNEVNIYECCICRQIFRSKSELLKHEQVHIEMPTYPCKECSKVFTSSTRLKEHTEYHKGVQKYRCSVCDARFIQLSELHQHMQDKDHGRWRVLDNTIGASSGVIKPTEVPAIKPEESDPESDADIDVVNDAEEKRNTYDARAKIMTLKNDGLIGSDEEIVIVQPESPEESSQNNPYINSFVIHDTPTPVIEIGGIGSRNHQEVSAVQEDNPGQGEPSGGTPHSTPTRCTPTEGLDENGSKSASTAANAQAKYQYMYNLPGPFTCSLCKQQWDTFLDFDNHSFSQHYRFPCMYCSKTFAQKANRDRHVCIHTGEKPYVCPECDEKFARGDKLKIHRIRQHNVQYRSNYVRTKDVASPKGSSGNANELSGSWSSNASNESMSSSFSHIPTAVAYLSSMADSTEPVNGSPAT